MSDEAHPVVVVDGHDCMGCGRGGVICLELGVQGGFQTLACQVCTNLIFDRAVIAIEKRNTQGPEESKNTEVIEVPLEDVEDK